MTSARPRFPGTLRRPVAIVGAAVLCLLLAGCQSGPQPVPEGTYRLLADASSTSPSSGESLVISADTATITIDDTEAGADLGAATDRYTLCPPSGMGTARSLGAPVTINGTDYTRPAVFGDCGQAKPLRVTIIDVDSFNDGGTPVPFTRWAEFCDTSDPDCP